MDLDPGRDLRDALTELAVIDHTPGTLAGLVDLRFAAVAGQSLGGAAAAEAAQQDHRFTAVVDLDGFPRSWAPYPYPQPVLALVAGEGLGDAAGDRAYADAVSDILADSAVGGYQVTVPDATHLSFTDGPLYLPPLPDVVGVLGRTEGPRITAGATLEFLDALSTGRVPRLEEFGRVDVHPSQPS